MTKQQCIHHWFLEYISRSNLQGTCVKCGKVKDFAAGPPAPLPARQQRTLSWHDKARIDQDYTEGYL